MSAGNVPSIYRLCEQSGFTEFTLSKSANAGVAVKNIQSTRSIMEAASGASIKMQEASRSLSLYISGEFAARKAAAIYAFYRATLPAAVDNHFDFKLLDDKALCKQLVVPGKYSLRDVRNVLFANKAIFVKSAELGCLIDFSFLDERKLMILSRYSEKRDALAAWIKEKVEATVVVAAPPLSEQMAQRTIRSLIEVYRIEAELAARAVSALTDKGDIEAAIDKVIGLKNCAVGGVPERDSVDLSVDPDASSSHSEGSIISNAHTSRMTPSQLSFKAALSSSPVQDKSADLMNSSTFPPLPEAAKTNKPAAAQQAAVLMPASQTEAVAPSATGSSSSPAASLRTDECAVCMDADAEFAFLPCGHRCACEACAQAVKTNLGICPMCSTHIEMSVKIFL